MKKRHKQSTVPPALAKEKEIKEEPIQQYNCETNKIPEKCRNITGKQQLWILWATKLVTFTKMPCKNGKMQ